MPPKRKKKDFLPKGSKKAVPPQKAEKEAPEIPPNALVRPEAPGEALVVAKGAYPELSPLSMPTDVLAKFVEHEEKLLELAKAGFLSQLDESLIREIMKKRGLGDLKLLDEMLRLRRGQATANLSVAHFDAPIGELYQKIRELEEQYRQMTGAEVFETDAVRDPESEGGLEGVQPEREPQPEAAVEEESGKAAEGNPDELLRPRGEEQIVWQDLKYVEPGKVTDPEEVEGHLPK